MIHEDRELAKKDMLLLIVAAIVAFTSQYLCIASFHHSWSMQLFHHYPRPSLSACLSQRIFSVIRDFLIVHISGFPSRGCPRGTLVVSSASVRCSGSGRRAAEGKGQLEQPGLVDLDLHCRFPKQLCTPRS